MTTTIFDPLEWFQQAKTSNHKTMSVKLID